MPQHHAVGASNRQLQVSAVEGVCGIDANRESIERPLNHRPAEREPMFGRRSKKALPIRAATTPGGMQPGDEIVKSIG